VALNCYQCSGSDPTNPFQCNEWLSSDIDIKPEPCDNVYNAKYCIKHIGRFEASSISCYQCSARNSIDCSDGMIHLGGIGAKRFCSSLDLGNYCNYVKQPGDILSYRTCVFTCSGDGCNVSSVVKPSNFVLLVSIGVLFYKLTDVVVR
ncbi:uncharacterized protein BDFB_011561, partial [Asbolus verrucosus]